MVRPELRAFAAQIAARDAASPDLTDASLPAAREGMNFPAPPLSGIPWREVRIPGRGGQPDVRAFLVNSTPGAARPAIVHMHGGGFVTGFARVSVPALQKMARELDCTTLTVDYRLAPETRFAGSIEDNYTALKWLHDQAGHLGVDPARIAVMGESAGGGHAALLAITARDRGEVPLVFQCLIYPMLDDRTGSSRTVPPHIGTLMHTPPDNRYCWRAFLGTEPGGPHVPARAVPARTATPRGLPPAFIGVGSLDLFVDEDISYARRLVDAGVGTELIVVPGAFHVFDQAPVPISTWFNAAKMRALRDAVTRPNLAQATR